ncbi:uncharacterized protein LOC116853327 [Odontomachus brunneus]|uniref:uncharacterized protein LOC116853327 n=1 Tax=Odontomachus brunneus TaxID=486640 RepID=UPI0013F1F395|nr:uncharacterized protein LOC116853327 [Odontomachus brunneus]
MVRALIDTGAEVNLVSESVVQRLRAGRRAVRMELAGTAETSSQVVRAMTTLRLSSAQREVCELPLKALVLPRLTAYKPPLTSIPSNWTHLEGLSLADDVKGLSRIDAVLGADIYASIIRPEVQRGDVDAPIAQSTRLGWILIGSLGGESRTARAHCHVLRSLDDELGSQLRRFWEVEELPPTSTLTQEELACEENFRETHRRNKDGRYLVRLPLRADPRLELADSERVARAALPRLERRLATQPELRAAYIQFMDKYERLGHITPA